MELSVVVGFVFFLVMVNGQSHWITHGVIPAVEDDNCTVGESIPCGSVIDRNGTVLRYERGNLTHGGPSIPSEDCPWKIRAPRGTSVRFETTCYHHFHVRNLTEYAVCFTMKAENDPNIRRSSSCGGGYTERAHIPQNVVDLSIYYDKGHTYELGFTIVFTFVGEPLPDLTTSSPDLHLESTTSDGSRLLVNYIFVALTVQVVFISVGLL